MKIRSLTQTRINYKMENPADPENSEWIEDNSYRTLLNEYDEGGRLLKAATYDPEGNVIEMYEYTYDALGQLAEEVLYYDEGEEAEHRWYQYNENGAPVAEKVIYQDGGEAHITYAWDEKGSLTEKVTTDQDGEIEQKEIIEWDGDKMMREVFIAEDNVVVSENIHTYDEEGRRVETIMIQPKDKMRTRLVFRYDEKGARTQMLKYNTQDKLIEKVAYTVDDKGNVTELAEEDAAGVKTTRSTFDDNGNTVLQEEYNDNEELNHRVERTMNEHGDMAESTVYIDNHGNSANQFYTIRYDYEYFQA